MKMTIEFTEEEIQQMVKETAMIKYGIVIKKVVSMSATDPDEGTKHKVDNLVVEFA
jgi:hypothetical protein